MCQLGPGLPMLRCARTLVPFKVPDRTPSPLLFCNSRSDLPSPLKSAVGPPAALGSPTKSFGLRPVELAPAAVSSLVPAEVPSVIHRLMLPAESSPVNSAVLPKTVRFGAETCGKQPAGETAGDAQFTGPCGGPVGHPKTVVAVRIVALEQRQMAEDRETRRETGREIGEVEEAGRLAPVTASSLVPAEVPSVTQRLELPFAS